MCVCVGGVGGCVCRCGCIQESVFPLNRFATCLWAGGGMGGWVGLQKLITDLDMRNGHKGGL